MSLLVGLSSILTEQLTRKERPLLNKRLPFLSLHVLAGTRNAKPTIKEIRISPEIEFAYLWGRTGEKERAEGTVVLSLLGYR